MSTDLYSVQCGDHPDDLRGTAGSLVLNGIGVGVCMTGASEPFLGKDELCRMRRAEVLCIGSFAPSVRSGMLAGLWSLSCLTTNVRAQDSAGARPLTVGVYAEAYLGLGFTGTSDGVRPGYLYHFTREGRPSVNLAYVRADYARGGLRMHGALAAGTYMRANYAAEPRFLRNILEANVGVRLTRKADVWLDAGVLPSHIGFESAVGRDNWNLTRSMVAENSPYYETGVRLSHTSVDGRLQAGYYLLTGWQRIRMLPGNTMPSHGLQVNYKASGRLTLNYSGFIGTDRPDSLRRWRHYHDLYAILDLGGGFGMVAGFDIGVERPLRSAGGVDIWQGPVCILRYAPDGPWAFAFRAERFDDAGGVIIDIGRPNGFRADGYSVNLDHRPSARLMLRAEARMFRSRTRVFPWPDGDGRTCLTATLSALFSL